MEEIGNIFILEDSTDRDIRPPRVYVNTKNARGSIRSRLDIERESHA